MPITKGKGKKDGLQQYRVRVNYTDANGKYRQVERTAYGLSEARKLEASIASPVYVRRAAQRRHDGIRTV